jgi:hypothetical protein
VGVRPACRPSQERGAVSRVGLASGGQSPNFGHRTFQKVEGTSRNLDQKMAPASDAGAEGTYGQADATGGSAPRRRQRNRQYPNSRHIKTAMLTGSRPSGLLL